MNHLLNECYDFLKEGGFPFAFCGGYAIELFLNKQVRSHGDIDISAFWEDRNTIINFMQSKGWTVYEACGGGIVHLINNIDNQKYIKRNIFCVKAGCTFFHTEPCGEGMFKCQIDHVEQTQLDYIEFLFNTCNENGFLYARNNSIFITLDKAIFKNNNIQYLSPELVLLYKSTDITRDGYQLDFDVTLPYLSEESKKWLINALNIMYPDGHIWMSSLSEMKSAAWCDLTDNYKSVCAELVGMIDSGERWFFEHSDLDSDFKGFVCNKMLKTNCDLGVLSACYYRNGLRICIAFDHDVPDSAEKETAALLQEIVKSAELNTFIWCRNENEKLRKLISDTFKVPLNYASREMSVTKTEFQGWSTPTLPQEFNLKGYDISKHESYINLLDKAMSHVIPPNTTPYLDKSDHLKERFVTLDKQNRFHALWYGEVLAGICFSDGGEIDTLAVDVNYRNKGLGYHLLFTALQNAFLYRDGDICLYVVDNNPNAYEFYKRTGMRVTGHSARYLINRSEVR